MTVDALTGSQKVEAWREELQRAVIEEGGGACNWARWLACIVQFEEPWRSEVLAAVAEYTDVRARKEARVEQKRAAAAQVAAIIAGAGEPLWVGRHKWIGRN